MEYLHPREDYDGPELLEADAGDEPIDLFRRWFEAAAEAGLPQPDAMVVATATPAGVPSARAVILRGYGNDGFVFYSNYHSRKGRELEANPRAAATILWLAHHRQVRIEGGVERLAPEVSDAYFATRPHGARLSAALSNQSRIIAGRAELEAAAAELAARHPQEVPRPPHWGGYRIVADVIEFWQGRRNRLHDRLRYRRHGGGWTRERLAP